MMTPKDLRQALPLFEDFLERFTPLLVDDHRTESRKERAAAYLRGLLLDAESTKTAEAIALKGHAGALVPGPATAPAREKKPRPA